SRAGLQFQRPIAFSDSMVGVEKPSTRAVSLVGKTAARLWPSTPPRCEPRSRLLGRQLSEKGMAPAKAAGPHLVKFMTSHSRRQKQTPRNGRSLPSVSHSDFCFIGKTEHLTTRRLRVWQTQSQPHA